MTLKQAAEISGAGWGEPIKHIEDKEWANQIINLSKNVQHKLSK